MMQTSCPAPHPSHRHPSHSVLSIHSHLILLSTTPLRQFLTPTSHSSNTHPSQSPFRCPYVPRHSIGAHMSLGTLLVPICARAPSQCPYVPRNNYSAYMYLGTLLVPIYAPEAVRFPYVPGHPSSADMWSFHPSRHPWSRSNLGQNDISGVVPF